MERIMVVSWLEYAIMLLFLEKVIHFIFMQMVL